MCVKVEAARGGFTSPKLSSRTANTVCVGKELEMAKCEHCGKKTSFGRNRPWSKKSTPRTFRPNLQTVTVMEGNRKVRKVLCAKCIRTMVKTS
jgi:large subunit ribosomal protein L28